MRVNFCERDRRALGYRRFGLLLLLVFYANAFGNDSVAEAQDNSTVSASDWALELRDQTPASDSGRFHRRYQAETWSPEETAVIVCDMWDAHHCLNAVRRAGQLAPRIDDFCKAVRSRGGTIIHAPSSCTEFYDADPARERARRVPPAAAFPEQIEDWCDVIPSEEVAAYPIDQSDGGEDDSVAEHQQWADQLRSRGRDPKQPWLRQIASIEIDSTADYISDQGKEIWSILESRSIKNVILCGVHTNMCVLGRPFGLRRLASGGKNVVLARDLTDTMYNPDAWPYASHFTGTDLIVDHVKRYVCPTIGSEQILGVAQEFQFPDDQRKRLLVVVADDEYQTEKTLPEFAARHLTKHFSVAFAFGDDSERHKIVGLDRIDEFDAVLISVRRRALPKEAMDALRRFVAAGKPVIGIRTASHAFSLRGKPTPEGTQVWDTWDADVFGGNYTGHYGNDLAVQGVQAHEGYDEMVPRTKAKEIQPAGSLYKTAPLAAGAVSVLEAAVDGHSAEPVAWSFVRADAGRSFYTSLGHPGDFEQPPFEALLTSGIHWACGLEPVDVEEIQTQNERYAAGAGKQR